jgi:glyoxylase I family protein
MPRIEHVAIFAADPAALRAFYEEAFGLRVVVDNGRADPPGYFLAGDGGSALEIIGRPPGAPAVNQRYVCHVAFWVEDVDATRAVLERRGMVFEADTEVRNEAMQTAFFRDPEGNRVQIIRRSRPLP